MSNNQEVEVVQVRMKSNTLAQLDKLQENIHAPGRSDAVRRAIGIVDTLVNAVQNGEIIIIEDKKGRQKQILITGLNGG